VHVLASEDDPARVAREADADAIGMAGGDGSLGAVAAVAIERDLPFVPVPLGTRNHFARDVGLDRGDPFAALEAFGGRERRVDVGRVGERVFLNNVALGLYAELVHRRERHRRRRDALASLRALALLARDRGRSAHFLVDGQRVDAPVLLVASNAYELDVFNVGERERLDDGLLHLYVAPGWRPATWEERSAERFTVDASRHGVRAAVDGEPEVFDTPLEFTLEPRALRVLLPPG
jgi:diacylglycerol kinase family enzyme